MNMESDDVEIVVDGQSGSGVLVSTGVGESVLDRIPMVMVTRTGSSARFAAVIEPRKDRGESSVDDVVTSVNGEAISVTVILKDGSREVFDLDLRGRERDVVGERLSEAFVAVRVDGDGVRSRLY